MESFWIKIDHPTFKNPCFLNASYHPPGANGDLLVNFLKTSATQISELHPFSPIFIGGDFNRLNLNEIELKCCLTILETPPTRNDAHLDLILTNRPNFIKKVNTFTPSIESDHKALIMTPIQKLPAVRNKVSFKDFSFKNKCNFNMSLQNTDFSEVYLTSCPNEAAELFDIKLNFCLDSAFPTRIVTVSDRDPPWVTPRIKWMLNKKRRLSKSTDPSRFQELSQNLLRQKINYLRKTSSKIIWRAIDDVTHRKSTKKNIQKDLFDPIDLNKQLARRCSSEDNRQSKIPVFATSQENPPTISMLEIITALRTSKNTSSGPDKIPSFVFRDFWDILAPILHFIWNLSLKMGVFPDCYKRANVTCIPKVNNPKLANDLRGISVTPIVSRLFERIVHKKWIIPKITTLGDPLQFAYKPMISTIDCLLSFQQEILSLLDKKDIDGVHCIQVDYSKAFDRVCQDKAALHYPSFIDAPNICQWLYSFTTKRSQRLLWEDRDLPFLTIDRGCSQGTVGGPNIFSIYTDDTRALHPTSNLFKYSDDTSITVPCYLSTSMTQSNQLSMELQHIKDCAKEKELLINADKTKHIRFCLNNNPYCNCNIDDTSLNESDTVTILGITFQRNCLFTKHCKQLIARLKSTLYIIKDLKIHHTDLQLIDRVFEALILSRIRYGLSVYGIDQKALIKIDRFLDSCFRHGFCSSRHNIDFLLQEEDKRILQNILKNPQHPLHHQFTPLYTTTCTRNKQSRQKPKTNTLIFLRSFCNRVLPL